MAECRNEKIQRAKMPFPSCFQGLRRTTCKCLSDYRPAKSQLPLLKLQPQIDILNKRSQSGRLLQNIASDRVASSWRNEASREESLSFQLQKGIKVSLIYILLIALNPTVYKSVMSKFFIQLYEAGTVKPSVCFFERRGSVGGNLLAN